MVIYTINQKSQSESMILDESLISLSFDYLIKECDELLSNIIKIHSEKGMLFVKPFEEVLMEFLEEDDNETMIIILHWLIRLLECFKGDLFTKFNEFINKFTNYISSTNDVVNIILKHVIDI